MAPRLLQNFNGGRAHIVTANPTAVETLLATLGKLGVSASVPELVDGRADIDLAALQAERDILFVDGDLDNPLALDIDAGARQPAVPVIGLVGVEAPSRLKQLVHLGATAFLRKPVQGGAVYTALFLGINQFLLRGDLRARLDDMDRRRRGRRAVVKAIIARMTDAGVDDDEAYEWLRRESMRSRQNLEDYCDAFMKKRAPALEQPGHESLRGVARK
ncbi:AmiR/NasT family two-component response regulator [Angulomicrobium tetraedrale]|uniref:AmiR/NasT family two-component response regulator n=1 Tax=Ancylobacter tetraedralis TaxID=217068 RepID=A0A839ZD29_9HYPH|nr:ANTAR domain-containing protein [Ancylobacter tetraedralis]MBB3772575.1 AmiR/NasT family two-component response regulator [Ancylobacter tetraedralis]